MSNLIAEKSNDLTGIVTVPGDKSISHRSIIFSALSSGISEIEGLLEGEDVLATIAAFQKMGIDIKKQVNRWVVHGKGLYGLSAPSSILDMGNSGTAARLLMGVLAGQKFTSTLTGDDSLIKRPMARIATPLIKMGAKIDMRDGDKLPLTIHGVSHPLSAIHYDMPVASAQLKSAILLAGLYATSATTIYEGVKTRDHSEKMLKSYGAQIAIDDGVIKITPGNILSPQNLKVPGDPSSAAFLIVAALITPGSDITIKNICLNPTRIGLIQILQKMGGHIQVKNNRHIGGEEVGDISVRHSPLKGVEVPASLIPSMIDECPILSVAASMAKGSTMMHGVHELRVKESDRIAVMQKGLEHCGVTVKSGEDWMCIEGMADNKVKGGAKIDSALDHRIAMSFSVLGLQCEHPVQIMGSESIETSFPSFIPLMQSLGAKIGKQ